MTQGARESRRAAEPISEGPVGRLLVVSPLDVAGSRNSRTVHLVRSLAPHFQRVDVMSRVNITNRSFGGKCLGLVRMQVRTHEEGSIRWHSISPWGNVRHGLGHHLLGLRNPYEAPPGIGQRALRASLNVLGLVLEAALLPSLLVAYLLRIRSQVDVVIAEGPWEAGFALLLRGLGRARDIVYDDIDYAPGFQPVRGIRRWLAGRLEELGVRRANGVISVGDRLGHLRRLQGACQVSVIPNGVDLQRFARARVVRRLHDERPPTMIYMGYLGAWAGIDLVLEAAALLSTRLPSLKLVLLGHGAPEDLTALSARMRELGLEGVVDYRGEVSYGELPVHLAEADLGLTLFRPLELTRYAFPLKVVEYMAAGLPVLTTADTEAADLVLRSRAGAAVPFDARAVAEAAHSILTNPSELEGLSLAAWRAAQAYDWSRLMSRYRAVLDSVLQRRERNVHRRPRLGRATAEGPTSSSRRAKRETLRLLALALAPWSAVWARPCRPQEWRRVLLYQGGGLGDLLRAVPLLEALREHVPSARVTLLAELAAPFETLLPESCAVDQVVRLDLNGAERTPLGKLQLALRLRRQRFDAVINPNRGAGMVENALFCAVIGARDRLGFTSGGAGFPFTVTVPFRPDRAIGEQNVDLLRAAGLPAACRAPQVRVSPDDRLFARRLMDPGRGPLVAVHPFADRAARYRTWPLESYVELVEALTGRMGVRVVLIGGAADRPAWHEQARPVSGVVDAVGVTTLGQVAAVLEAADLFIGNDSGLLHLALALGRPAVAIFGSTAPEQVIGRNPACSTVRTKVSLPCQPCYRHQPFFEIDCEHVSCLRTIQVDAVLRAVEDRLSVGAQPTAWEGATWSSQR